MGRLVSFQAVPPKLQSVSDSKPEVNWTIFFAEAGLDPAQWRAIDARLLPPSYADTLAAWQGSLPNMPDSDVRIEAAAFQGKPVSFQIISPWSRATQQEPDQGRRYSSRRAVGTLLLLPALLGGLFFARRNLRLGRGDRRNANRLAFFYI
jgi:hypothetical protein